MSLRDPTGCGRLHSTEAPIHSGFRRFQSVTDGPCIEAIGSHQLNRRSPAVPAPTNLGDTFRASGSQGIGRTRRSHPISRARHRAEDGASGASLEPLIFSTVPAVQGCTAKICGSKPPIL